MLEQKKRKEESEEKRTDAKTKDISVWKVEDVAEYCRVRPGQVRYWMRMREIPFIKLGKSCRFDPQDIKDWLTQRKSPAWNGRLRGRKLRGIL